MDSLFKLVDERINKYLSNSPFIVAVPCVVLDVLSDNMLKVQLTASKAVMTVPNWSGSSVEVGENVQLFYRGAILSEQSAYVGASLNKASAQSNYVQAEVIIGTLFETERDVAVINFNNSAENILLGFNAVIQGDRENIGIGEFSIYLDGELQDYSATFSVIAGGYTNCSFTIPMTVERGDHEIEIKGIGDYTTVLKINAYAWGDVKSAEPPLEPTSESDYIYYTTDDTSETIYYIGESLYPIVPDTFDSKPLETIGRATFNYSDAKAVSIPDGVERIE